MTQDRMTTLFFEIFSGLPRQGPGDTESTLRALALVPTVGPDARVLDVGCGTGLPTRVLAQNSAARFIAIDNHELFVNILNEEVTKLGLRDRVEARVGDMSQLEFPPGSFDLIWCEGAVYVVGVESVLRRWRPLLAPGGHIAITEACWMKPDPPPECAAFWEQEYPAIRDVSALLRVIEECGYETVGHFALPPSSWWDDYYRPLQRNISGFRDRHRNEPDAQAIAEQVQREINMWHAYAEFYSYQFFVMRPLPDVPGPRIT